MTSPFLGRVSSSTPLSYLALMAAASTPEMSKLRLREPYRRSRRMKLSFSSLVSFFFSAEMVRQSPSTSMRMSSLAKPGQIGLDQVMIALVENIGFAGEILFQVAEIAEKAAFQVGEGVHIAVISVFKRNKIKHKAYLHTSYWTVSGSLWMAAGRWKPCKIVRGRIAVCNAQPPSFLLMLSVYPPFFTENRIRYE